MIKDLFSKHAGQYATFRPSYPQELYDFIYKHVAEFENAWDAGTGNGQVAVDLARKFRNVFATDISAKQLENAVKEKTIHYSIASEKTEFPDRYFDLICVAQAIHWFDRDKFYEEVRRVSRKDAILVIWGYGLLKINDKIDSLILSFYKETIGEYWDAERKYVDAEYKTIAFPFEEISCPPFFIRVNWSLDELEGYLTTWSSVQKYIQKNGRNPVEDLIKSIQPLWGSDKHEVKFPVFMRMGKVGK